MGAQPGLQKLDKKEFLKVTSEALVSYLEILENENEILKAIKDEAATLVYDVASNKLHKNIDKLMHCLDTWDKYHGEL